MIDLFPGEHSSPTSGALRFIFYQHLAAYNYFAPKAGGLRILEVGCGDGYGSYLLASSAKSVLALDADRATINNAKEKYRRRNLEFRYHKFPYGQLDGKFDIIVSLQVIEHINNPQSYLEKIIDHLTDNGILFLTTPNAPMTSYNENPYHFHEYSKDELYNLLTKFFNDINIMGLVLSERMFSYEENRKRNIFKIFSFDVLGLRHFLPRSIRIFLFNILAVLSRTILSKNTVLDVNDSDFQVKEFSPHAIDLVAVCRKRNAIR